jgi:hypothetical protein
MPDFSVALTVHTEREDHEKGFKKRIETYCRGLYGPFGHSGGGFVAAFWGV